MHTGRDTPFLTIGFPAPQYSGAALTASKADLPVVDRRDLAAGIEVVFDVTLPAVATADSTNYMDFEIFEADEKTSSTALTSGTKAAAADVMGPILNDVAPEPKDFANQFRVNATTMAGKRFQIQYLGYKPCIQLRITETGTASVQPVINTILWSLDTKHVKAGVVS